MNGEAEGVIILQQQVSIHFKGIVFEVFFLLALSGDDTHTVKIDIEFLLFCSVLLFNKPIFPCMYIGISSRIE